jgi:hypothetical protein
VSNGKAPGPDGFNGALIKSCWDIIANDLYELIDDFIMEKSSFNQ